MLKEITAFILALLLVVGVAFGIGALNLGLKSTFGVANSNLDRQIYEQSQSYVAGKKQELHKYRMEYEISGNPESKQAIANIILHTFAEFDVSKLSLDDEIFLQSLK